MPVTEFNVRYLTTLSVSQIVERLMNDELEGLWREAAMV